MSDFMNFSSDRPNVFLLLLDSSGSMSDERSSMMRGLEMYRKSFQNFPEVNSIAVSVCRFSSNIRIDEFKPVKNIDIHYDTGGTTALYYSISEAAKYLMSYIKRVTEEKGIIPRATFVVFSDGQPEYDPCSPRDGKKAIENLNYSGVTTVFIAFGNSIRSEFGKKMGFQSVIDVDNREVLTNFIGVELSNSCKEQSQSMKPLGANFFSKAVEESEEYSQSTMQALEDTSWIDDI